VTVTLTALGRARTRATARSRRRPTARTRSLSAPVGRRDEAPRPLVELLNADQSDRSEVGVDDLDDHGVDDLDDHADLARASPTAVLERAAMRAYRQDTTPPLGPEEPLRKLCLSLMASAVADLAAAPLARTPPAAAALLRAEALAWIAGARALLALAAEQPEQPPRRRPRVADAAA
jgi:hypothetical protein